MWVYGLDSAGPGQGQVADACECGNEPSGSVKCGEFLDQLQTSQLLKKDSVPWSKQASIDWKAVIDASGPTDCLATSVTLTAAELSRTAQN